MMVSPQRDRLVYGSVSNGEEFIFLKVLPTPTPQYSTSKLYATFFHRIVMHSVKWCRS
jgi:hypothetical protein